MARVYMLANVLPGKEKLVRDTLRGTNGVIQADTVTGQFDLIVTIEGKDTNDIFNKILKNVRKVKGITRTETFVTLE